VQHAVGEDMPAFEIGRDLDFIDREKTTRRYPAASPPTVETQNRAFGGLIFSSPVISATESTPARSTILL